MKVIILPAFYLALIAAVCNGKVASNKAKMPLSEGNAITDTAIIISGNEQQQLNLDFPNGALPPVPGVLNIELLRTTRDAPQLSDGDGWTYAHHMDLAEWRGRLYAAWNMTEKDEDVPPSKVVYATSPDGLEWSNPADLFPRELAWACRFYFYHTQNDKMLTFCAARLGDGIVTEALKSVVLVREILPDHTLGEVFTLIHPIEKMPALFESSANKAFVEACREAVNNNMLLEQQDYGIFLGDRKMIWHARTPQYKGHYPFGKAFSFYQRKDKKWVGISKMGFVTTSGDEGMSWSEPELPSTLIAGAAKIWGQRTMDNRYVLAYNPDPKRAKRYPLVLVNGDDGIHFRDMRVVHGEYPQMRYPGKYKDYGYQYVRGVPSWSSDHSFKDSSAVWLIYSVHKEDIWLSRIPLPVIAEPKTFPADNFENMQPGAIVKNWNIYSPKWAPVRVLEEPGKKGNLCLELQDSDPTDYARAMRLFPATNSVKVKFRINPRQANALFECEIQDEHANLVLGIRLTKEGTINVYENQQESVLRNYLPGKWMSFNVTTDPAKGVLKLTSGGKTINIALKDRFSELKTDRIVFRTGSSRKLGNTDHLVNGEDKPLSIPALFLIDDVSVKN